MDALPYVDTLFKEYLLFRGFTHTLTVSCSRPRAASMRQPAMEQQHSSGNARPSCWAAMHGSRPSQQHNNPLSCPTIPPFSLQAFQADLAQDPGCGFSAPALTDLVFRQLIPQHRGADLITLLDFLNMR
jgi:hypothetical protein